MNLKLQREIINHIFIVLGIIESNNISTFSIKTDQFLIDKKIIFEFEGNEKYENNIFAASAKVENSEIKMLVADISDGESEYAVIIQMDAAIPNAMRLCIGDEEDFGSIMFNIENEWIAAGTSFQAKILVGIESLSEIYLKWNKLDNYFDMYKLLIGFLNCEKTS